MRIILMLVCLVVLAGCRGDGQMAEDLSQSEIISAKVIQVTVAPAIWNRSDHDLRIKTEGCKFSVDVEGQLLYFVATSNGDGTTSDMETCAVLNPGDMIQVQKYITNNCQEYRNRSSGDPRARYSWRSYCLRTAL